MGWRGRVRSSLLERLSGHGFIEDHYGSTGKHQDRISQAAFDLLSETPPYKVFVSYKHSESSAFALLVVTRLKEHGLYAFCDMRLVPGDPWHAELENRVRDSKFQVLLLGPTTL